MKHYIHRIGFHHAWEGMMVAFTNHPNFKIHSVISFAVFLAGLYFAITRIEWIILISIITVGFVVEMINTAIESVVDLVTEEWRMSAKIAKDVSSGAMLIFALGATLIALLIFYPYFVG